MHRCLKGFLLSSVMITSILNAEMNRQEGSGGYLSEGTDTLDYKDGRIAFEMWVNDIAEKENIHIDVEIYDDHRKILDDFTNSLRHWLISLNPLFYLQEHQAYDKKAYDIWASQYGHDRLEKMVLIVRKGSGISTLADIKGKKVMSQKDDLLGRVFLDKELLTAQYHPSEGFIDSMSMTDKESTAILKTYFGKVDACIVKKYAFEVAREMNPALGRELKILVESPRLFMPLLILTHISVGDDLNQAFARNVADLENTVKGRNILTLFKMKRLIILSDTELQAMREYYHEYLDLKRRFGKASR